MLKDYFHGKLSPNEAASEFVKSFDLEPMCNRSFQGHLEYLAAIAYDVSDPRGQTKVVKLLVAIRNLRCGLWCEVLAPIKGGSQIRPESNIQWNNLNARLASVNTCNIGLDRVGYLCDSFIKHDDVRENAVMFNIGVSAAAQYMIYSASNVFEVCERERNSLRHLGWGKWKAGFKEAQTNPLINASGKNHATLAVAAMNEADMGLESPSGAAGVGWTGRNIRGVAARESKGNKGLNVEWSGLMMKRSQASSV